MRKMPLRSVSTNKYRRLKQRQFSRRLILRLTKEADEALTEIVNQTQVPMGKIFEIAVGLSRKKKIFLNVIRKRITTRRMSKMLPLFRTLTVGLDISSSLALESRFKHYPCRSLYAGAIFIRVLQAYSVSTLVEIVRSRPDVLEALTYVKPAKSREASLRLRQRL